MYQSTEEHTNQSCTLLELIRTLNLRYAPDVYNDELEQGFNTELNRLVGLFLTNPFDDQMYECGRGEISAYRYLGKRC